MKFTIPLPLQHEHEALHERLRQATQAGGEVGEAAKTLARLMHPHFVKEDQIALPPLGLLAALARGEWSAEMAEVLTLTEQLEAELPQMLAEHQTIVAALNDNPRLTRVFVNADDPGARAIIGQLKAPVTTFGRVTSEPVDVRAKDASADFVRGQFELVPPTGARHILGAGEGVHWQSQDAGWCAAQIRGGGAIRGSRSFS